MSLILKHTQSHAKPSQADTIGHQTRPDQTNPDRRNRDFYLFRFRYFAINIIFFTWCVYSAGFFLHFMCSHSTALTRHMKMFQRSYSISFALSAMSDDVENGWVESTDWSAVESGEWMCGKKLNGLDRRKKRNNWDHHSYYAVSNLEFDHH